MRRYTTTLLALLTTGLLFACGSPEATGEQNADIQSECKEGATRKCTCQDGKASTRVCEGGEFGACECGSQETVETKPAAPAPVATCAEARACTSVTGVPTSLTANPKLDVRLEARSKTELLADVVALAERDPAGFAILRAALEPSASSAPVVSDLRGLLDAHPNVRLALRRQLLRPEFAVAREQAVPPMQMRDATTSSCAPAQLVLQVSKITVHEEDDDLANDKVYCMIAAEGVTQGETRLTPRTPSLDEGDSFPLPTGTGVFWGQKAPVDAGGDLKIEYNCFEEDSSGGYAAFAKSAGEFLSKNGTKVDDSGYLTTAGDLIAKYLPSLLALDSDDHLLKATQTIPRATQLALTNGAKWAVRKSGSHLGSDWDWELEVNAYGCVANGVKP